jgi:hypothetical protein
MARKHLNRKSIERISRSREREKGRKGEGVRKHFDDSQQASGNTLTLICETASCVMSFRPQPPFLPFTSSPLHPFSPSRWWGFFAVMMALSACPAFAQQPDAFDILAFERARVLQAATRYLSERPITLTASTSPRSAGGAQDFFSEGDYWWPDPGNPEGPYIQRDGLSNPDNFTDHRRYLMRLSVEVAALAAAWKIAGDLRYARHAANHLRAWFIDARTRMNPHLKFAQAIKGRVTGRGIGIIDTIHLVEVARAVSVLDAARVLSPAERQTIKQWFAAYLRWMTTHPYGIEEREAKNNHATCWVMQVAEFARLTDNRELLADCRRRFKTVLLPNQMALDGSFPQEMRRTKPYGYALFNLEAMAVICQILSTAEDNLWQFELVDGRGMRKGMEFMAPYIGDKKRWPLAPDVMYDKEWPMRQSSLLFAGLAFGRADYLNLWKRLPADSTVEEVIRNFFIRQPVLWVEVAHRPATRKTKG